MSLWNEQGSSYSYAASGNGGHVCNCIGCCKKCGTCRTWPGHTAAYCELLQRQARERSELLSAKRAAVLADKGGRGMSAESICEKCGHDEVEHRADVLPFAVCRHVEYTDLPRSQVAVFSGVARACPCVSFVRAAGEGDT